jgi:mono/diheme cytochrome c family protein
MNNRHRPMNRARCRPAPRVLVTYHGNTGFITAHPMRRSFASLVVAAVALTALAVPAQEAPEESSGWIIPPEAKTLANPVEATPAALRDGMEIYREHCRKCHGASGKGDGPDADPDDPPKDLSDPARARLNPPGVVFYRVWNGRKRPDMPSFRGKLTQAEVWALVHYVATLRKPR